MPDEYKASGPFSPATARPEHALLLLLCARAREENARRAVELARAFAFDWDYFSRLARRHAVEPVVHRGLEAQARGFVPEPVRISLKDSYRANAARNVLLAGELLRVAGRFESEGIGLLAYKGPALAVAAYGDLSLRRFADLDVIVRVRDVARASELLRESGYATHGLTREQEAALFRSQHNIAYARDGGRLVVELHWGLASEDFASVRLDDGAWARAARVPLLGGSVAALSAEDLLTALCVHGAKHLWERLAWVCDVAGLVNSNESLDWRAVFERARESRVERMLLLGLGLAHKLLGARLPRDVLESVGADEAAARLSEDVAARMFDGAEYRPAGLLRSVGFNLRARARARERLRYFRFILTPTDGDLAALALPARLSFVYYLVRPFRLLLKDREGH